MGVPDAPIVADDDGDAQPPIAPHPIPLWYVPPAWTRPPPLSVYRRRGYKASRRVQPAAARRTRQTRSGAERAISAARRTSAVSDDE